MNTEICKVCDEQIGQNTAHGTWYHTWTKPDRCPERHGSHVCILKNGHVGAYSHSCNCQQQTDDDELRIHTWWVVGGKMYPS